MKKVLLASTALAFSAGWAMADVTNAGDGVGASITLSGEGKIGVIGNDRDDAAFEEIDGIPVFVGLGRRDAAARFYTDVDLKFTMRGMTDGGLEFGVIVDLDEADEARGTFDGERQGGEEVYLKGAFGNLTMGDTDGAFDWAMSESIIGGTIGDVNEHAGYSGNSGLDPVYDGQVARYDYTFGDMGFSVAASATIDDYSEGDPVLGIGAKYAFATGGFDITVGGGYQWVDAIGEGRVFSSFLASQGLIGPDFGASIWGVSANVDFGAFQFIADYSTIEYTDAIEDSGTHWGVAFGYEWDAWLFAINYGHAEDFIDISNNGDNDSFILGDSEGYALTANYDLGGGAVLQAGISSNERLVLSGFDEETEVFEFTEDSYVAYSFGVSMAF